MIWSTQNTTVEPPKEVKTIDLEAVNGRSFRRTSVRYFENGKEIDLKFNRKVFYRQARLKGKEWVLKSLRDFCEVKERNKTPYKSRRRVHIGISENQRCAACGGKAAVAHHVIMIVNGGNPSRKNTVPLCHNCHTEVHLWMMPEEPGFVKEMDASFRGTIQ